MKRPIGVILSGILQVLGSLVVLLFSIAMLLMPLIMRRAPGAPTTPTPSGLFAGLAAFYGVFAILGLLTAIGLFRLKRWSRYSTLIFAGVLVATGLFLALAFAFMPVPATSSGSATVGAPNTALVRAVTATISLAIAALGGIWLYYFNRHSVREAFSPAADAGLDSKSGILIGGHRVPLSIAIIGGYSLFGAICTLASIVWFPSALIFGFFLIGKAAIPFMLFFGAAYAYIGVGLLKLWKAGRTVGILFYGYSLINAATLALTPAKRLAQMTFKMTEFTAARWSLPSTPQATSPSETTMQSLLSIMRLGMIAGIVTILVILYFLVTRKNAFQSDAAAYTPTG
jgi:hypothetical protein